MVNKKEIKKLAKPEFEANPDKFYPTNVFAKYGFTRNCCPKCGAYYWRHTEKADTCGDSNCVGKYKFIGKGTGIGAKGKKVTLTDIWNGFKKSFTNAKVPCTAIDRYPVVARWRNDVDYVAAGIYCFQPYCVTGELDPPANPLICPQFCIRFNDLDNIGLTGRHYSGFVMIGIQVFNYPDKYVFFKEECVEYNYLWLTEELEIDPDEITFIEDVWAGGGNLGPSIEYFVNGLEVGNMVFMQYKTFPDGSREELPIKIIDTGIGMERLPWLINGTPTSYFDTFANALQYILKALDLTINNDIWEKLGPYTCLLNIDEVEDIDKTWKEISGYINEPVDVVKKAIEPIKDLYIVLDHTRTVFMIIYDGSLPSNVGGGSNVRNILRRVFAITEKQGWWKKLGMDGFIEIFEHHKKDLEGLYGKFAEHKSFRSIIEVEYERWKNTESVQNSKLLKVLKKNPTLTIDDWIIAMTSWGIPADLISQISKQPIPGNLYYEIATRQERIQKAAEVILYDTSHLVETKNLTYEPTEVFQNFKAKVVDVFTNVKDENKRNLLILDQSGFYPTSGGQANDKGTIQIGEDTYNVVNVEKVGKCVLHTLDKELPDVSGKEVNAIVDLSRRKQLRNHHTATHLVFAASRKVLGQHVWQNGAKKTIDQAHLDITHYTSLTKEQNQEIENEANRTIMGSYKINKYFMEKSEAEKEFGFRLYQGGVVAGNQVRIVNINGIDVEACCGTHCDNTAEVGWIRILKSTRISDGIVRIYFVAGERTISHLNHETKIMKDLENLWGVNGIDQFMPTANKFFNSFKKSKAVIDEKDLEVLSLQVKLALNGKSDNVIIKSSNETATLYFGKLNNFAEDLQKNGKSIIIYNDGYLAGILGNPKAIAMDELKNLIQAINNEEKPDLSVQNKLEFKLPGQKVSPLSNFRKKLKSRIL